MTNVTVTSAAAERINSILAKQPDHSLLRVAVDGGGCSGFSYRFEFADRIEEDDQIFERDGARVVIDDMSLEFLDGSEIDFTEEIIGASFRIKNPNATASCGCGTSFSV